MNFFLRVVTAIYLCLIGLCIGSIVVSSISASVIFNANSILRLDELSNTSITYYDSGILMTAIFARVGKVLNSVAILILVYESLAFKGHKNGFLLWLMGMINAILIFLFTLYYIPGVEEMQMKGAASTVGPEFERFHQGSVIVIKLLMAGLVISFIARVVFICSNGESGKGSLQKPPAKKSAKKDQREASSIPRSKPGQEGV